MIYISGISIALFISALLLNKKNKSKSDLILFLWMVLMAIHLLLFYINAFDNQFIVPQLLGFELPLPLLHGVLLFYYVSSVTNQLPKKKLSLILHLTPILFSYASLIPFWFLTHEQKLYVYQNNGEGFETLHIINLILIYLSGVVYVVWTSILLRKHKKNIRNQFSDIENINLKWLQFLTIGLGVVWSIVIFNQNTFYIFTAISIFIILIGFFGVQQIDIFSAKISNVKMVDQQTFNSTITKEKYAKSGLTDVLAEDVYNKLLHLLSQEAIYKENDLSLNDLASTLDIHPNYLSQIINEKRGESFYDLINTFRVEEFKGLIKIPENQQFTLIALAYDCGFNSKSSFNRYFKKHTGLTPSQYAKSAMA